MKISNIISTFLYIMFGVLLAISINQGIAFVLATDMPVVAVESNSMVPTFYKGDILVLQGVRNPDDYIDFLEIGDIIVFSPPNQDIPVVHRIIKINPDGTFQTKGDANRNQLSFEDEITPEQIHGKIIAIVPYLGWVKIGMTEYLIPNVIWIIIGVTVIYLVYYIFFVEPKKRRLWIFAKNVAQ